MQATGKTETQSTLPDYLKQPFQNLVSQIGTQFGQGTPDAFGPSALSQQYFNTASQPANQNLQALGLGVLGQGNNFIGNQAQNVANTAPNNALGDYANQAAQAGQNSVLGNTASKLLGNVGAVQNWTDPGVAQQWMNPYEQTALQSQMDLANRQFAQQQAGRNAAAIGAGAFGGDRQAIADATAQSQFNQQLQNLANQGLTQAYQTGQQGFQVQQGLGLEAAGLGGNLQAQQNQLAMQAPQVAGQLQNLQNQYGLQVPSTAAQLQNLQNQYGLNLMQTAGGLMGQQNQYGLNTQNALGQAAGAQQNLQAQQAMLPYQMLQLQSGLLGSMPGAKDTTATQYQRTNPMASIMGMLGNVAMGAATGGASSAVGGMMGGKGGGGGGGGGGIYSSTGQYVGE